MSRPLTITIDWDDAEMSVGIAKLDEQHKQLVGLLNALITRSLKEDPVLFERILTTLVVYTRTHFQDEEKILRKMNFPGLDEHRQKHLAFVNEVLAMKADFDQNSGSRAELAERLIQFLRQWLVHHICSEDRRYSQFLFD